MALEVVAPMPGTIAEILVSVGDEVQADEELIICLLYTSDAADE